MTDSVRIAGCQHLGDGGVDLIIDLPPNILQQMHLSLGDSLDVEVVNQAIVHQPIRSADSEPSALDWPLLVG